MRFLGGGGEISARLSCLASDQRSSGRLARPRILLLLNLTLHKSVSRSIEKADSAGAGLSAVVMLSRFQSDSISSIGRPVPFAYTDFSFFSAISASSAFYFRIFVP